MIFLEKVAHGNKTQIIFLANIFFGKKFTRNAKAFVFVLSATFITVALIQDWKQGQDIPFVYPT